jgi:hypothetical protein
MLRQENLAVLLCTAHLELGTAVVAKLGVAHFNVSRFDDSVAFCEVQYTREACRDIGVCGREFDILQKCLGNFRIAANVPESAVSGAVPSMATPIDSGHVRGDKGGKRMSLFSSVSPESVSGIPLVENIIAPFFKLEDESESIFGNSCILAFVNLTFEGTIVLSQAQTRVLARLVTVLTIGRLVRWSYTMVTRR